MKYFTIRKADAEDFPIALSLVAALLEELGAEGDESGELATERLMSLSRRIGDRHITFLAVTPTGSAIGLLTLAECFAIYANGLCGVINEMYVQPEYRSAKVGAALIDAAAHYGRASGWRRIDVTAPESDRWARSLRFYESQGFLFTGPKLRLALAK